MNKNSQINERTVLFLEKLQFFKSLQVVPRSKSKLSESFIAEPILSADISGTILFGMLF